MEAIEAAPRQAELFPTLIGGKRPRRRSGDHRKLTQQIPVVEQLDLLDLLLNVVPADNGPESWSVKEIELLHDFLLERSIEVLADARSSQSSIREILDWICAPNPRTVEEVGFSFPVCCRISGYDADELRDQLIYETRRLHDIAA